ncbi:hypothetical protein [Enterobacter hormaechei]|nr:hypothetical protein [Enterobacter hormaechei]
MNKLLILSLLLTASGCSPQKPTLYSQNRPPAGLDDALWQVDFRFYHPQ